MFRVPCDEALIIHLLGPHDTEYINVKYVKTYCGLKSRFQQADEGDSFILLCTPGKDKNIKKILL